MGALGDVSVTVDQTLVIHGCPGCNRAGTRKHRGNGNGGGPIWRCHGNQHLWSSRIQELQRYRWHHHLRRCGCWTVTASSGGFTLMLRLRSACQMPPVTRGFPRQQNPTTSTTTSGLATDLFIDDGTLVYSWSASPATVSFSANNTNGAQSTLATFTAAGTYTISLSVSDPGGNALNIAMTVNAEPARLRSRQIQQVCGRLHGQHDCGRYRPIWQCIFVRRYHMVGDNTGIATIDGVVLPVDLAGNTINAQSGGYWFRSLSLRTEFPVITSGPTAGTNPTTLSTTLSVLATDPDHAESALTYTWSASPTTSFNASDQ